MKICLCATRNLYPQLQTMISMLMKTQPSLEHIYVFVEDELDIDKKGKLTLINVKNYEPLTKNEVNNGGHWSYMTLTRCYFTDLLPNEDKVLYLDLDIMIEKDISELWNMDISNYACAGVVDSNMKNFDFGYIEDFDHYVNAGVLLMNLKYMREHGLDKEIDRLLHTNHYNFPDQDVINIACKDQILIIDPKWNSGAATKMSTDPYINHVIRVKPWDPKSAWFKKWVMQYFLTGANFSIVPF